ncbi:MAG: SixA phosphatase family protein [Oceanococcus sp.]
MSKTLYLLRHGLAEDASNSGIKADYERELSAQGRVQIACLAACLAERDDFSPQIALVSAAIRTRQTAEYLTLQRVEFREDYYNADLGGLLTPLRAFDDGICSALIVAHNPGISWLGSSLLQPQACRGFSPGSILAVQFGDTWDQIKSGCARLLWRLDPPNY